MGDTSLPYLTVGGQRIRGMSESEWTQYLDAAGYPKTSKLPVGYQSAAPTPLVPLPTGSPAAKAAEKAQAAASEPAYQPPPVANQPRWYYVLNKLSWRSKRQRLDAIGGAQQANLGPLKGKHPHRHYARPLAHLGFKSRWLGDLQTGHVDNMLAVIGYQRFSIF